MGISVSQSGFAQETNVVSVMVYNIVDVSVLVCLNCWKYRYAKFILGGLR